MHLVIALGVLGSYTFFPFKPIHKSSFSENKDQLTKVENLIVRMIAGGATNTEIANEIGRTEATIKMLVF
jgi:DNA-binding NarL/FixJ family response regulator